MLDWNSVIFLCTTTYFSRYHEMATDERYVCYDWKGCAYTRAETDVSCWSAQLNILRPDIGN